MREGLSYDDVLLVPKEGILEKRKDAYLGTSLTENFHLGIPIISAPMSSVTEYKMARAMALAGGLGVIHRKGRFEDIQAQVDEYGLASKDILHGALQVACAIGINDIDRLDALYQNGCRVFFVDVAHAHHKRVGYWLDAIRGGYPKGVIELIAGNVATHDGALFLEEHGVDGIKVGIGPGAACITREVTGFGVPQLTAISYAPWLNVPVIADGGIKNSGDIVKALAAGASSVMIGSLFAGADEAPSPGNYWGEASKKVNGHNAPEGVEGTVVKTGPVSNTIKKLTWGIRSGLSYAGATNIQELRDNAEFIRVSPLTQRESSARI